MEDNKNEFSRHLRYWRKLCGFSQNRLADEVDLSYRHYNFLENGRSKPSPEVVVKLAKALSLSLKNSNMLLRFAGFAYIYPQTDLQDVSMKLVRQAIDRIVAQQEPYPAVVMSPIGKLITANQASMRIYSQFIELSRLMAFDNVYELFFSNEGLKPYVSNWNELAPKILSLIRQEVIELDPNNEAFLLYNKLKTSVDLDVDSEKQSASIDQSPIFSMVLRKEDLKLSFFSTYTSMGTPLDVTLQNLRIECFYPADEETEDFCIGLVRT